MRWCKREASGGRLPPWTALPYFTDMSKLMIISILGLTLSAADLDAQHREHGSRRTAAVYMTVGMSLLDTDGINNALTAQAYRSLSDRFFSLGAGGHLVLNQAVIGVEGQALLSEQASSTNDTFRATLSGRRSMLQFGYLVFEGDNLDLYPLLGVGYGSTALEILDPAAGNFDEVLADPRRGSVLHKGGPLLGAAVGGDWVFEVAQGKRRGPALGFRLGYDYAPIESDWSLDGTPLLGGPELSLTGPYLRILFGFGGRGTLVGVR